MDIEKYKTSLENKISIFTWIGGFAAVFAIIPLGWAVSKVFLNHGFFKENELGDFIGGVSGTFASFSALCFVYVGFLGQRLQILFQQEELELNRNELKETRKEIMGQKEQLELQNKQFQIQAFNTVFFKLLDYLKSQLTNSFVQGSNFNLSIQLEHFKNIYIKKRESLDWEKLNTGERLNHIQNIYKEGFKGGFTRSNVLSKLVLSILRHIDKNQPIIDQSEFLETLILQLSIPEQQVIYYTFFSDQGFFSLDDDQLLVNFLKTFDKANLFLMSDKDLLDEY